MARKKKFINNGAPKKPVQEPSSGGRWKLELHVKPGQSRSFLKKDDSGWVLGIREPARDGLANKGVRKALSDFLDVPVSKISIMRGETSRIKLIVFEDLTSSEGLFRLEQAALSLKG